MPTCPSRPAPSAASPPRSERTCVSNWPHRKAWPSSVATKPGGYFVPGTVMVIPELDTVKGTVVCESTFHEYYTTLEEPYRFEVDGEIQSVTGGGTELAAIDRSLKRAGNGNYGNIVHFHLRLSPGGPVLRANPSSRISGWVGCNAGGARPPTMDRRWWRKPSRLRDARAVLLDRRRTESSIAERSWAPSIWPKAVDELQPIYG